jgi:hypothetical protein
LEDVRYVYFPVVGFEELFDAGPRLPMVDPVARLVAVRLGSWWLLVGWALDGFTPGLFACVEDGPEIDFEDPFYRSRVLAEGGCFFDGLVDGLSSEVWAGLPGRVLTGYDLMWDHPPDDLGSPETLLAVRLAFGDDVVTVVLGEIRPSGAVTYSADELLVVRGAALGDGLVRRFLEESAPDPGPETPGDGNGMPRPQPWGELAAADGLWAAARRRVLAGGAESRLRRGLAGDRQRVTALTVLLSAPPDLVERLFPDVVECALAAEQPGAWAAGRAASAAARVLGRLPAEFLHTGLALLVEALAVDPSASAGRVSAMAWLVRDLGLGDLARTLAERRDGGLGDERPEQPGEATPPGGGAGTGARCHADRPAAGDPTPQPGEPPTGLWAQAVAAYDSLNGVLRRMVDAGRDNQSRLALRDAAAAPTMLRLLGNSPPYWTQAVFGDVLGWALGSSDLVGPAREAIRRLPRGWVRFELSGRVADLAGDPGAGWEARTRMGQLLEFLGEADLLAVLRRGSEAPGPSSGGGGAAGTRGGG